MEQMMEEMMDDERLWIEGSLMGGSRSKSHPAFVCHRNTLCDFVIVALPFVHRPMRHVLPR